MLDVPNRLGLPLVMVHAVNVNAAKEADMSTYLTVSDAAKEIRSALKTLGFNNRHVSVKSQSYSGGSSIRVRILDASVPFSKVSDIANAHESIHRDQFGEILSGANRFVDVAYSRELVNTLAAELLPAVEAAVKYNDDVNPCYGLQTIGDGPYMVGRNDYGRLGVWISEGATGSHVAEAYDAKGAAEVIADRMLLAGRK